MEPNEHELKVLRMLNNDIPMEYGSWVNACFEFLQEMGLCTRFGKITEEGQKCLVQLKS